MARSTGKPHVLSPALLLGLLAFGPAMSSDPPATCIGFDDSDGDGVPDECDRCPGGWDPYDADGDLVPDDCDVCPGFDDRLDLDLDGNPDACDLCSDVPDNVEAQPDDPARPSMLITADELPSLRLRIQNATDPSLVFLYDNLITRADVLLNDAAPVSVAGFPSDPTTRGYELDLTVLAFAYLMQDPATDWQEYRCEAIRYVEALLDYPQWNDGYNCFLTRHALARGLALAYDWLYDDLPADTRERIVDKLELEMGSHDGGTTSSWQMCDRTLPVSGELLLMQGQMPWYWNRPWQNTLNSALSALGVAGQAIVPEHAAAQAWIDYAAARLAEQVEPDLILSPDGSWHEGATYHAVGLRYTWLYHALAFERGVPYPTSQHHVQQADFLIHSMMPDLRHVYSSGDVHGAVITRSFVPGTLIGLASSAQAFANPYAQRLLTAMLDPADAEPPELRPFQADPVTLLLYDENLAASPLSDLPTARLFDDIGTAVMRNCWDAAGAQCPTPPGQPAIGAQAFGMKSGWPSGRQAYDHVDADAGFGLNNGHDHSDANSLVYFDQGEFLLHDYPEKVCPDPNDDACPGCSAEEVGLLCTRWHNTITVTDDQGVEWGQVYPECLRFKHAGDTVGLDRAPYCVAMTSVDPLSMWTTFDGLGTSQYQTDFSHPEYKHLVADARPMYQPEAGLARYLREVVMTDRYFVVFDRVGVDVGAEGARNVNWYFHSPGQATVTPNGERLDVTYDHGSASLEQQVLWPAVTDHDCKQLTSEVNLSTPELRGLACGDVNPAPPSKPDMRVRITATTTGAVEMLSLFRSTGPGGSGTGVSLIQAKQLGGSTYRLVIDNGDGTRDTLRFSRTEGLIGFTRQTL